MRKIILFCVLLLFITGVYGMTSYSIDLKSLSEYHFNRLCDVAKYDFKNLTFRIYEYDNLFEFRKKSGGSFYIKGFTNSRGTFIQSKNLLKEEYTGTLIHELLHALIKSQYPVPPWFEEGIVCLVTEEFSNISGIPEMENIESFKTNLAESNWQLISYCLGCVKRVKEITGIE